MAKSRITWSEYFKEYLGVCSIGDEGCEYLSRGQWPKLNIISVCKFIPI